MTCPLHGPLVHCHLLVDQSTLLYLFIQPISRFHEHVYLCRYTTDDINAQVDEEVLYEKEETIQELKDTVQILEMKVQKLEQLVRIKDGKIQTLVAKLQDHAIHAIE